MIEFDRVCRIGCAAALLSLAACATQVQLPPAPKLAVSPTAEQRLVVVVHGSAVAAQSKDWEGFRTEWRNAFAAAAAAAGMTMHFVDKTADAPADPAVLAVVTINDYRYVTQGARFAVGIMTGNAFVDADVAFSELPAKTALGTRKYNTTSSAGQGIFSPMTEKQIQAISDEIVKSIRSR
jgi:hypothetical protein